MEASSSGNRRSWGCYGAAQLPSLVQWLEGGSDGEQELAERIHEAVVSLMPDAPGTLAAPEEARRLPASPFFCDMVLETQDIIILRVW